MAVTEVRLVSPGVCAVVADVGKDVSDVVARISEIAILVVAEVELTDRGLILLSVGVKLGILKRN